MAEPYTGSATIGTTPFSLPNNSTTLTPITVENTYQVFVDFGAMAIADSYQIEILEKVTSGGSQRSIAKAVILGTGAPGWVSPAMRLKNGWDVQVKKLAGTDRSISWSIRTPS